MAEAQNFTMAVNNYINEEFTQTSIHFTHGSATNNNPIAAKSTTVMVLRCQGDANASAGTEGTATYENAAKTRSFSIAWDIPWGPETSYLKVTSTKGCQLTPTQFTGDSIIRTTGLFALNEPLT